LGTNKRLQHYNYLPSLESDRKVAEGILTLSSATNGDMAVKAWKAQEENTGQELTDLISGRAEEKITFNDISNQQRRVQSTPVFRGVNEGDSRYSSFTTNIQRLVPFPTVAGRQHFYLDPGVMLEGGEEAPKIQPANQKVTFYNNDKEPEAVENEITL